MSLLILSVSLKLEEVLNISQKTLHEQKPW